MFSDQIYYCVQPRAKTDYPTPFITKQYVKVFALSSFLLIAQVIFDCPNLNPKLLGLLSSFVVTYDTVSMD